MPTADRRNHSNRQIFDRRLLRPQSGPLLFCGVFDRGAAGHGVVAELPRLLRRHRCRRPGLRSRIDRAVGGLGRPGRGGDHAPAGTEISQR